MNTETANAPALRLLAQAMTLALSLLVAGCARAPAQCAQPLGLMPEAPREQHSRRLVMSRNGESGCHVEVQLPATTGASEWRGARDAALATALDAARTCCAQPRARNLDGWPAGATTYDVAFDCAAP